MRMNFQVILKMSKKYDQKWLNNEMLKDQREINHYKESLIESIKQTKKDDIFTTPKKQTINIDKILKFIYCNLFLKLQSYV